MGGVQEVSSDGHQMSLAGGRGQGRSDVWGWGWGSPVQ